MPRVKEEKMNDAESEIREIIDTLWRGEDGDDSHWKGRVCKVYSKVGGEWKMTMHTGVLVYS